MKLRKDNIGEPKHVHCHSDAAATAAAADNEMMTMMMAIIMMMAVAIEMGFRVTEHKI